MVARRSPGWVPAQHGAWAMILVPALVGSVLRYRPGSRCDQAEVWALAPLLMTWLIGYFAFNAWSLWLKARRRERLHKPVAVYTALTAVFGLASLALQPSLWQWGVVFAPLMSTGLWLAARREERALLGGAVTVLAAALMTPVTAGAEAVQVFALRTGQCDLTELRWITAVLFGYFFGTVWYVKTMIRERGSRGWLAASAGYHVLCLLVTALAVAGGYARWAVAAFFLVCLLRALAVPAWGPMQGRQIRPVWVGLGEIALTVVLSVLCLAW